MGRSKVIQGKFISLAIRERFKSILKFSEQNDVTRTTLYSWMKDGVPPKNLKWMSKALAVPAQLLNYDLFNELEETESYDYYLSKIAHIYPETVRKLRKDHYATNKQR